MVAVLVTSSRARPRRGPARRRRTRPRVEAAPCQLLDQRRRAGRRGGADAPAPPGSGCRGRPGGRGRVEVARAARRRRGTSTCPSHRSSSRSGWSSRQWDPRVSWRSGAASTSALATVSRLVVSQAAVPGSLGLAGQARGGPAARGPPRSAARRRARSSWSAARARGGRTRPGSRCRRPGRGAAAAPRPRGARRSVGRTRAPREASSTPAGWRRARRSRRPRRWRRGRARGAAVQVGGDAPRGVVAGRRDRDQLGDRVDAVAPARRQDGGEAPLPLVGAEARASSHTCSAPVSRIRRMIALATTSRGARSASGCWPSMKRVPSSSTRNAPSPRTASEISGCCPRDTPPSHITVGWNCTNSRSRSTAPARSARAIPSPVATAGLVVAEKTWPSPPLASTTARHSTAPTPSRWPSPITCSVTPATPPPAPGTRSRARACG